MFFIIISSVEILQLYSLNAIKTLNILITKLILNCIYKFQKLELNLLYYKNKLGFLKRIQIHTVQRIVTKFFTVIPDSFLEVSVPFLLGNTSNILIFLQKYVICI